MKPIKLYGGYLGPNPLKISFIFSELDIPYENNFVDFAKLKTPEYEVINPNGRLPAIHDPNTDITIWESGAILEYILDNYDQEYKLSFAPGTKEFYHARQWLYYQVTGQGPYYGQAVWFKRYHAEQVDSAVQRYVDEIKRVSKVLDKWLEGREWLVGDKMWYADLAFVPWQNSVQTMLSDEGYDEKEFPRMTAWLKRMSERPKVKGLIEAQERLFQEMQKKKAFG